MITWRRVPNYSDVAVNDAFFLFNSVAMVADYIIPGVTGDIVWENNQGQACWFPAAQAHQVYYLGARRILSSGTVNGSSRSTTATGIAWFAINQLANNP